MPVELKKTEKDPEGGRMGGGREGRGGRGEREVESYKGKWSPPTHTLPRIQF